MRDRARDCDVSASLGAFWLTGLGDALGMSRAFSGVANADVGACVRVCVMKFESGHRGRLAMRRRHRRRPSSVAQ